MLQSGWGKKVNSAQKVGKVVVPWSESPPVDILHWNTFNTLAEVKRTSLIGIFQAPHREYIGELGAHFSLPILQCTAGLDVMGEVVHLEFSHLLKSEYVFVSNELLKFSHLMFTRVFHQVSGEDDNSILVFILLDRTVSRGEYVAIHAAANAKFKSLADEFVPTCNYKFELPCCKRVDVNRALRRIRDWGVKTLPAPSDVS